MAYQDDEMNSNANLRGRGSPIGTSPEPELEFRDFVTVLRKYRNVIIGFVFGAIALAVIYNLHAERRYSATTTIELNKESSTSLGLADLSGIGSELTGGQEMNVDILTQERVIESPSIALDVIKQLKLTDVAPYAIPPAKSGGSKLLEAERGRDLDEAPYERERVLAIFSNRLSVGLVKGTRLITVTYTDADPSRAADIANAVVASYIESYTKSRYLASTKASHFLTGQLAELKQRVAASQKAVNDFQEKAGLERLSLSGSSELPGATAQSESVVVQRLQDLNKQLTNAEITTIAMEAIYRMTETQDPDVIFSVGSSQLAANAGSGSVLSPASPELTVLTQLRQERSRLQLQITAASTRYGAKNPALIELRNQLSTLDTQIVTQIQQIHRRARSDADLAKISEQGLRTSVAEQQQLVGTLSSSLDHLLLLQQDAAANRLLYADLSTKLEEANVAAGAKASNVTVVDPARLSTKASSPRSLRNLGLALAAGLILGLIVAFGIDYLDDTIVTPAQLERITKLPIIGLIPRFNAPGFMKGSKAGKQSAPQNANSSAWLLHSPRSGISEAYRQLRTAILLSRPDHAPRSILFTSSLGGDGKSTTCFNTAIAFALQGSKVLLIDADMRKPRVHVLAGCSNEQGLSQLLSGSGSTEDFIQKYSQLDNLFILPAGPNPPTPSELLGSLRFRQVIDQLVKDFDFICIDSPPMLLVTDSLLIAQVAETTLAVVRSGVTTKSAAKRFLSNFIGTESNRVGILLNSADLGSAEYSSGYTYYGSNGYYADSE